MTEYIPDSWVVVKIQSEQHGVIYKVLAGWSGSYTYGSSWKLSSGIVTFVNKYDHYESLQDSGSTYLLYNSKERMNVSMAPALSSFEVQLRDYNATIEVVKAQEVIKGLSN